MQRFWDKVQKTETCWFWTGAQSSAGYGQIRIDGKSIYAHRMAYELLIGPIPDGMFVCHHCDNPACINPEHLFAGTAQDNASDMAKKKRWGKARRLPRGSAVKSSKLTEAQVVEIKRAISMNLPQPGIARQYGVSTTTINLIARGIAWKWVTL